jgi:phage-related minor tail protein
MTDLTTAGPFVAQDLNQVKTSLDNIGLASDKVSSSLTKTFANAVVAGKSFDLTLQSVLSNLSRVALNGALQSVAQGLTSGVNSLLGGLLGGLSNGVGIAGATSVGVQPFADGGIVARPTFFGSGGGLGLMGERGAEAIMPLARGPGGELGVVARGQGGGASVNVTISTPDAASFQRSQVQISGALARAVARGQRGV